MKDLSNALKTHLAAELTTLAELVKITRLDGTVIAFTTHDQDLVLGGVTYRADGSYQAGKIKERTKLEGGDYEISGLIDSALIDEADLKAGLYDHARVDVYLCNWADTSQGAMQLRRGWLGEIAMDGGRYKACLRSFQDLLTRKTGETYTPECRYDLGDTHCGVDVASFTVTGSVTAVTDRRHFTDSARTEEDSYFSGGKLTWTSGANAGVSYEVNAWTLEDFSFKLWLPTAQNVAVGDTYEVIAGCDKCYKTCRTRFDNGLNYGGFPYLPGIGKLLDYPDAV